MGREERRRGEERRGEERRGEERRGEEKGRGNISLSVKPRLVFSL